MSTLLRADDDTSHPPGTTGQDGSWGSLDAPGRMTTQNPRVGALLASTALLVLLVGYWASNPSLVLLALGMTTTAVVGRRLASDLSVVATGLLLLLSAIAVGSAADVLHLDLLEVSWLLAGLYLVLTAGVAAWSWRRPRWTGGRAGGLPGLVAFLPAFVAGATAMVQGAWVTAVQSWAFYGTDFVSHAILLFQVQQDGGLDYGLTAYPRGLHMLATLASVPGAPIEEPSAMLGYDLRLVGALVWLALAYLLWTGTVLTIRLGGVAGLRRPVVVTAAVALGTITLLTNTFMESFVDQAAAPSLVAVGVLFAMVLVAIESPRTVTDAPRLLALTAIACVLLAHLWQALLVVPVAATLVVAAPVAFQQRRRVLGSLLSRRALRWYGVISVAGLLVLAPLTAIIGAGGAGVASRQGEFGSQPWRLLVPGMIGSLVLLRSVRHLWARAVLGTSWGLLIVIAVLLHGAGAGLDLRQWYPLKACWFLAVFLSPWLALVCTELVARLARPAWSRLGTVPRLGFILRSSVLASLSALALTMWLPWQLGPTPDLQGAWQPYDSAQSPADATGVLYTGAAFDVAVAHGTRYLPAVVVPYRIERNPLYEAFSLRIVSDLLSFQTGQPSLAGTRGVCEGLRQVAGHEPAVVLTRASVDVVRQDMARQGCAGRARVKTFSLG